MALIKSTKDENKHGGQKGLTRTPCIIVTSAKIQVHILTIIRATVVPPGDSVGTGQPSAPLGFIEEQAISEER